MNAYLHYYYYARPFFYVPTPQGRAPTNITCFYKTAKHNRAGAQRGENNNGLICSKKYIVRFFGLVNTICSFILFLHREGKLTIDIFLFKSIMIVAFSIAINTLSGIVPMRFLILFLSIVLIWFGITVTVSANSLLILFDIMIAGLVFPISDLRLDQI